MFKNGILKYKFVNEILNDIYHLNELLIYSILTQAINAFLKNLVFSKKEFIEKRFIFIFKLKSISHTHYLIFFKYKFQYEFFYLQNTNQSVVTYWL